MLLLMNGYCDDTLLIIDIFTVNKNNKTNSDRKRKISLNNIILHICLIITHY